MSSSKNFVLAALSLLLATAVSAHDHKDDDTPQPQVLYGVFREDCFEKFFTKQDFSDSSCI